LSLKKKVGKVIVENQLFDSIINAKDDQTTDDYDSEDDDVQGGQEATQDK
jgi:hypothetical protein